MNRLNYIFFIFSKEDKNNSELQSRVESSRVSRHFLYWLMIHSIRWLIDSFNIWLTFISTTYAYHYCTWWRFFHSTISFYDFILRFHSTIDWRWWSQAPFGKNRTSIIIITSTEGQSPICIHYKLIIASFA